MFPSPAPTPPPPTIPSLSPPPPVQQAMATSPGCILTGPPPNALSVLMRRRAPVPATLANPDDSDSSAGASPAGTPRGMAGLTSPGPVSPAHINVSSVVSPAFLSPGAGPHAPGLSPVTAAFSTPTPPPHMSPARSTAGGSARRSPRHPGGPRHVHSGPPTPTHREPQAFSCAHYALLNAINAAKLPGAAPPPEPLLSGRSNCSAPVPRTAPLVSPRGRGPAAALPRSLSLPTSPSVNAIDEDVLPLYCGPGAKGPGPGQA